MPGKKKNKGSKLGKMSEEERLRYLQHRAEVELEAKRRKEQLIAGFIKNKLKREEAFSRLNHAKINEQWRFKLRQFKSRELYEQVEYLWNHFDETFNKKNSIIDRLYSELENSDVNHRRLQQVHILMIDKLIDSHRKRLEGLHNNYIKYLMLIKIGEFNEMSEAKRELIYSCKHLETVIYTENYLINDKLLETMTRNAINTYNIEFTKIKDIDEIRKTTGENISKLWFKLKQTIANYQNKTKTLREQYENLKKFDKQHKNETINFPQLENFLTSTIDILKNQENLLTETRNKNIKDLEIKIEIFNSRVLKLRDKSSVDKITDNIQLKKLSVISGKVIDDLKKIEEKSRTVTLLINLCLNIEPFLIGKCTKPINPEETDDDDDDDNNTDKKFNLVTKDQSIIAPYHLLDNFWKAFNNVKAENYIRKKQLSKAIAENNKLKRYIKSYFGAVTRATAKLTD